MVDIREFFGNTPSSGKKNSTKRASSAKDQDVIEISDDTNEQSSVSSKGKPKGLSSQKSSSEQAKKSTTKRPKVEAVGQDHSRRGTTSHEPIDIDKPEETGPRKKAKIEKNDMNEPKNDNSQEVETVEGNTAEEILAKIKDAELPETEDLKGKPYQFFQKRKEDGPVPSGGVVDVPEAKPNCLSGLTIIFTGVLPNLDRNDAENLAKQYGAKVTKSILGKTSLVVIGEDAGPSKIEKIKKFKTKAIDELGFLTLLRSMPSEGGSGDAAIKAKQKRELEEQKILEEAKEEERKLASESQKKHSQSSSSTLSDTPARVIPDSEKLWTVKYAPKDMSQLCGNKGQVNKLKLWLERWFDNAKQNFKNPGSDGSGIYRACLISGPPGIGKTSAAHLVARSLGLDVLEKNASDVRSKSLLNSTLKSALDNTSVVGFFKHQHDALHSVNEKRFCLIMDEVDGMSSGDHGGTGTLSSYCKITKMPLILICNDKSLPKMRTFDRVTYDLPFRRPSEVEVKARLMTIAHREKIKLDPTVIGQLVQATSNDIRQMINLLSTVSRTQKNIGHKESKEFSGSWQKQTILKPFDITARFFSAQTFNPNSGSSLNDKIDLYFNDIDFTPLMIQENYLFTRPAGASSPKDHLRRVAEAADDISKSDHINSLIRSSEQQWSLLPFHGVMSSVRPCLKVAGNITQRINFAGWLGQNSKSLKYQRLLQEIQYHTRLKTSTDKAQLRLDYLPLLTKKLTTPLIDGGESSIPDVISVMDSYYLTKEDWAVLVELGIGPANGDLITKKIPTKVKTAFTRLYNAQSHPVAIYKTGNSVGSLQPSRSQEVDFEDVIADDTVKDEDDDQDLAPKDEIDTKKDKLIKEVKPKKPRKATTRKAK